MRLVGWYITSEMTTPCRRDDGPKGSFGKDKYEKSIGRVETEKVRCELARMVLGVLARSRTLLIVRVFVTFGAIGLVVRTIVRESAPKFARCTVMPLLMA